MKIGDYNYLKVLRFTSVGIFLGDTQGNDILLPNKYVPERISIDDEIKVFIYTDSEDRPIATTLEPKILVDEFATLKVKELSTVGAFMDWGLEKDLLVPFSEQKTTMEVDYWYLVYLYLDPETNRLVCSTKITEFFTDDTSPLKLGQEVKILVGERSPLGYTVVVENNWGGMVYNNEVFKPLKLGQFHQAWIKNIREDGKLDISMQPLGHQAIEPNAEAILNKLREEDGFLPLTDNSQSDEIQAILQMSKKSFKRAVGTLYKQRLIVIEENGIRLS